MGGGRSAGGPVGRMGDVIDMGGDFWKRDWHSDGVILVIHVGVGGYTPLCDTLR